MKCTQCGKEYTYESVRKRYGSTQFAEYGVCSEECYTAKMTGIPLPNNSYKSKN